MSRHIAVVGLGFGDEGKGTIVDYLCARWPVRAVVRFNGGAQAGHNVLLPDGRHHTFAQWGSGTFRGVPTLLSHYTIIDPIAMISEALHLVVLGVEDPWSLLLVDQDALVATPYHKAVGRARELARGKDRHGSVGMGVGETVNHSLMLPFDALRAGELPYREITLRQMTRIRDWAWQTLEALGADSETLPDVETVTDLYNIVGTRLLRVVPSSMLDAQMSAGMCVFEGAQGVLLDEWRGFHPYTTWSTTTFDNAVALAGEDVYRLGVLRCYTTRHGPGPLPTEDPCLSLREPHNDTGEWQGAFRVGHFDVVAHRYAVEACRRVDGLALTHVDVSEQTPALRISRAYDTGHDTIRRILAGSDQNLFAQGLITGQLLRVKKPVLDEEPPRDWPTAVSDALGLPVVLTSHGPTVCDKHPTPGFEATMAELTGVAQAVQVR